MSELINMIQAADDFCSIGSASSSTIANAEKKLKVVFADDYKEYVLNFGAATFDGRELTGICNSNRLNVVSVTEQARQYYPSFPSNAYVIEELMFDHILIIQDSLGRIYSYGPKDSATQIAKSLKAYLFP